MNVEIFAHGVNAYEYTEEDSDPLRPLYVVAGKDWESNPFKLFLNREEAEMLLLQLGYHVYEAKNPE